MWYDRDGAFIPLEQIERVEELLADRAYCRVARSYITDAANPAHVRHVSTVWIGIDMQSFRGGPPVIFETKVFDEDGEDMGGGWRYSTEFQALEGHAGIVAEVAANFTDPVVIDLPIPQNHES
jgi:hypothetical protein